MYPYTSNHGHDIQHDPHPLNLRKFLGKLEVLKFGCGSMNTFEGKRLAHKAEYALDFDFYGKSPVAIRLSKGVLLSGIVEGGWHPVPNRYKWYQGELYAKDWEWVRL